MNNVRECLTPATAPSIVIRPYRPVDAWRVTDIFYNSVHAIEGRYYSLQEINAWAPLPVDYAQWARRLNTRQVQVAEADGNLVGFTAMEADGYIDWLYVHSDFQRLGVASALYARLEQQARHQGLNRLQVHASHLARPFFLRQGFRVVASCSVQRLGVELYNWKMEKSLI
ncbi:GNAT family N-acetyltransferase [Marinobacterium sp. YM272]|uniref:GNAT family N-acetyltransferase n=1 Tax=Marinobacterium sp. YM272 TaxID=3421654 RepID=UPI003D7F47AE